MLKRSAGLASACLHAWHGGSPSTWTCPCAEHEHECAAPHLQVVEGSKAPAHTAQHTHAHENTSTTCTCTCTQASHHTCRFLRGRRCSLSTKGSPLMYTTGSSRMLNHSTSCSNSSSNGSSHQMYQPQMHQPCNPIKSAPCSLPSCCTIHTPRSLSTHCDLCKASADSRLLQANSAPTNHQISAARLQLRCQNPQKPMGK